jgi:hypothetical protein
MVALNVEAAPGGNKGLFIPKITGTAASPTKNLSGAFKGSTRITRMKVDKETRTLKVTGVINGNVRYASGQVQHVSNQTFTAIADLKAPSGNAAAQAQQLQATCPILDLDIGPIHLDLLGLVIDLNEINLDIVAQSGPGQLLGNLLCALVGILDGDPLGDLAGILTSINNILQSVLLLVNRL